MLGPTIVALLAEGVGRNTLVCPQVAVTVAVALLAEGVGRNRFCKAKFTLRERSPSSRRAWVEIMARPPVNLRWTGRPPRGGRG